MPPQVHRTLHSTLAAFATLLLLLFGAGGSATAMAQAYPARAIRIIVPFAPGGGNDFIARFIAQQLTASLKQSVYVENRPGAGGLLGVETGLQAPPDGYTLVLISLSYTVNPSLYKLKFDPVNDMTPVIQISRGPLVIVTPPSFPAHNVRELIARAKAAPGTINYASSGEGSIIHLASEYFASMAGIKMAHIPYKGGGPALTDTLAGRTEVFFSSTAAALPHLKSGTLRALAVTTPTRNAALPDVPSVAESGLPDYDVTLWHALIGPKGIPQAVVQRLNAEVDKAVHLAEARALLENDGVSPAGGTPDQLRAQIARDIALYGKVATDAGLKPQ